MTTLKLEQARITLGDVRQILDNPVKVELSDQAWRAVGRSRASVEDALSADIVVYCINNVSYTHLRAHETLRYRVCRRVL